MGPQTLLWSLFTIFFTECTASGDNFKIQIQFVSDYISFYNIRFVTVLEQGPYVDETACYMIRQLTMGLMFNTMCAGETEIDKDDLATKLTFELLWHQRIYVNVVNVKATRNATKEGQQLLGDSGLVVSRLLTRDDLTSFAKIVTIATFSPQKTSASLWETYQISKEFPKRTFIVGDWVGRERLEIGGALGPEEETDALLFQGRLESQGSSGRGPWRRNREIRAKVLRHGVMRASTDDPLRFRDDLTGLHLRCATLQYRPLTSLIPRADKTVAVEGILGSFFREMAALTNFTYTCRPSRDGQWGAVVNNEWTGIIRDILDDVADIGVAAIDVSLKRSEAVSYLQGIVSGGYRIYMKKPTNDDYMWSVYTKQFSKASWMVLMATSAVLTILLFWITQRSPAQPSLSLADSSFLVLGFILGQGTRASLTSGSCRVAALMGLALQVLLLTYYTSDLVSSLAAGPPPPTLSTLYDVYNNGRLKLGFTKGIALQLYFSESTDPTVRKLWQAIKDDNYNALANSMEEGMQRVLRKPYLYMDWGIPLRYDYGHDCRLYMLPTSYFHVQTSFTLKKNSPLVPVLNKVVLDILSSGLLEKWWRDWTTKSGNCGPLQNEPVGVKTVFGPFFVFSAALVGSLCVLACEVWLFRKYPKLNLTAEQIYGSAKRAS
ncbi:probable glutamate receptor [Penaeus chinensis]|uniref:probable glutamate receptor n=1 Tax=Penaeus chinensis TaxID=139456 RepID=UPI001FB7CAB8|nr:probable glutamate receptor [Penaeus chinensis]